MSAINQIVAAIRLGLLPDFDFTKLSSLDSRFTFARNSVATLIVSTGLLENAPHNVLTYSDDFTNAVWNKLNLNPVSGAWPWSQGTLSALNDTTSTATYKEFFCLAAALPAGLVTHSAVMKAGDCRYMMAELYGGYTASKAIFDLVGGTVTFTSGGTSSTQMTQDSPGVWRCSLTSTQPANSGNIAWKMVTGPTNSGGGTYVGNLGQPAIYFGAAQCEQNARATKYLLTTTAARYDSPRFDYDPVTLAPIGLLIEEQRTNLLLNADSLVTQNVTVTAAVHSLSFYGSGSVTLSGVYSGVLTGSGAFPTRAVTSFTPSAGTLTLTINGQVQFANLEIGAFPTSYVRTTGTSATRSIDSATITTLPASTYDILIQDRNGGAFSNGVVVSGSYALAPRTGQTRIARLRFWPAGQLNSAQKTALAVAYP